MKIVKTFWIFLGSVFTLFGIIGLLIPVVPQVPFLLAAAFCFSKGSRRMNRWIRGTKIYRKYSEKRKKKQTENLPPES